MQHAGAESEELQEMHARIKREGVHVARVRACRVQHGLSVARHLEEASVTSAYVRDLELKRDEAGGVLVHDADHMSHGFVGADHARLKYRGVPDLMSPLTFLRRGGIRDGSPQARSVDRVAHSAKRFVTTRVKARRSTGASGACVVTEVAEFLLRG
jgi:hypothetical protein